MSAPLAAIWHDVECGGYEADLPLWEELAERCGGPILELGCGTGRVALHLARRGYQVYAVDRDHELVLELAQRARGLPVEPICVDALDLELSEAAELALAPMQFLQLLRSPDSRRRCLRRTAAALRPGGLLAVTLVSNLPVSDVRVDPLPDAREIDGWVYSSYPTGLGVVGGRLVLNRMRQVVSPDGERKVETNEIQLSLIEAEELKGDAESAGFALTGLSAIPETEDHVGSTVVLLERRD